MDLDKIIRKLHEERMKLDQIIASLEKLQTSSSALETEAMKKRRGRKSMDEKGRREVSERMKRYWAARKKKKDGGPPTGA